MWKGKSHHFLCHFIVVYLRSSTGSWNIGNCIFKRSCRPVHIKAILHWDVTDCGGMCPHTQRKWPVRISRIVLSYGQIIQYHSLEFHPNLEVDLDLFFSFQQWYCVCCFIKKHFCHFCSTVTTQLLLTSAEWVNQTLNEWIFNFEWNVLVWSSVLHCVDDPWDTVIYMCLCKCV